MEALKFIKILMMRNYSIMLGLFMRNCDRRTKQSIKINVLLAKSLCLLLYLNLHGSSLCGPMYLTRFQIKEMVIDEGLFN